MKYVYCFILFISNWNKQLNIIGNLRTMLRLIRGKDTQYYNKEGKCDKQPREVTLLTFFWLMAIVLTHPMSISRVPGMNSSSLATLLSVKSSTSGAFFNSDNSIEHYQFGIKYIMCIIYKCIKIIFVHSIDLLMTCNLLIKCCVIYILMGTQCRHHKVNKEFIVYIWLSLLKL